MNAACVVVGGLGREKNSKPSTETMASPVWGALLSCTRVREKKTVDTTDIIAVIVVGR